MAQDTPPTPAEQAFINYPTVRQRYQIAGGVLVPAANNDTVATGNVTVISGGEATLDRIASGDTIEAAVDFLYLPLPGAWLDAGDVTIRAYEGGVVILRSPKQENLVKLRIIEVSREYLGTAVVSKWSLPVSWRQWLVEVGRPHMVQFTVEKEEATTTSNRRKGEIPDDATGRCLLISCSTIQELDVLILAAERRVAGRKKIERIMVNQPVLVLDHRRGQWEKRLVQVGVGLLSVYDYRNDGTSSEGELVKRMPLTMNLSIRSLSDLGNCTPFTRGLLGGLPGNGGDVWEVGLELCSIDDDNRVDHTIVLMPRSCEERDTLVSALRLAMTTEPPPFDGPSVPETDGRGCRGGLSGKVQRLSKEVEELRAELRLARKLASTGSVDRASRALVSSSLMPAVEEDEEDTLLKAIQEGASRVVDSIKTTLSPGQEFAALRDDEDQLEDNPTYLRRPQGSVTFGRGLTVSESPPVRYAPRRHQSGDLAARLQKTTDVTSIRFASP
ncbi:hypothetical protein FOZ61_008199, partial [Perkinsus olseni]